MKKNISNTPPAWQKDAIPTPLGLKHPRTGELLVSIKLDMSLFAQSDVEETVEVEQPTVEETVEVEQPTTEEPVKTNKKAKK